jgi:hypothetical protein
VWEVGGVVVEVVVVVVVEEEFWRMLEKSKAISAASRLWSRDAVSLSVDA